jgi:hypothetical protein
MLKSLLAFVGHYAAVSALAAFVLVGGVSAGVAASATPRAPSSGTLPTFQTGSSSDWYAIGDSYIAGEGTADYYSGTNGNNDYCHRSPEAYAPQLGVDAKDFFACSGATIQEIENGMQTEPSQVSRIPSSARVILLSAGGDSLGFPSVLSNCVSVVFHTTSDSTCEKAVTKAEDAIPSVRSQLVSLLDRLHHRAPQAWIVLVGYPLLFSQNPQSTCSLISEQRQKLLNQAGMQLDSDYFKPVVKQLTASGLPVWYVDTLHAFSGHELCDSQQYLNQLTTNGLLPTLFSLQPVIAGCHPAYSLGPAAVCAESFHPDADGYAQLERVVTASLQRLCQRHCAKGTRFSPPSAHTTPPPTAVPPSPTTTTTTGPPTTTAPPATTPPPTAVPPSPTTTTTAPPTTPSGPGYSSAQQQWMQTGSAPAAGVGSTLMQAASDLQSGLSTDTGTSGYPTAISELTQLASIPETSDTPQQMAEAQALVAALDTFFNTPGFFPNL